MIKIKGEFSVPDGVDRTPVVARVSNEPKSYVAPTRDLIPSKRVKGFKTLKDFCAGNATWMAFSTGAETLEQIAYIEVSPDAWTFNTQRLFFPRDIVIGPEVVPGTIREVWLMGDTDPETDGAELVAQVDIGPFKIGKDMVTIEAGEISFP